MTIRTVVSRGYGNSTYNGTIREVVTRGYIIPPTPPTWLLNGVTASIAPYSIKWRQMLIGHDHTRRPIYSGNWEIDMSFDSASITFARQWMESASAASANVTVLKPYSIGFTSLSGVQLEIVEAPTVESGMAGPWSMIIRGASPN